MTIQGDIQYSKGGQYSTYVLAMPEFPLLSLFQVVVVVSAAVPFLLLGLDPGSRMESVHLCPSISFPSATKASASSRGRRRQTGTSTSSGMSKCSRRTSCKRGNSLPPILHMSDMHVPEVQKNRTLIEKPRKEKGDGQLPIGEGRTTS